MRPAAASLVACLLGCSASDADQAERSCDPVELASQSAAAATKDCGHVALGTDPRPAWACATEAFRARVPFRVSESLSGIDSTVTITVVGAPDSAITIFSRDSDPVTERELHGTATVTRVSCSPGEVQASPSDGIERVGCGPVHTSATICK
jgi:hypothetical protein